MWKKGYLDIINYLITINQIKKESTVPLINNLKIIKKFKDEDEKEGVNIINFISAMSQLLIAKFKELVD